MYTAKFESWPGPALPQSCTTCGKQLFGSTLWRDRNHRSLSTLLSVYLIEGTFSRNEPAYGAYAQRGVCFMHNKTKITHTPRVPVCVSGIVLTKKPQDPNESKFQTLLEGIKQQSHFFLCILCCMLRPTMGRIIQFLVHWGACGLGVGGKIYYPFKEKFYNHKCGISSVFLQK